MAHQGDNIGDPANWHLSKELLWQNLEDAEPEEDFIEPETSWDAPSSGVYSGPRRDGYVPPRRFIPEEQDRAEARIVLADGGWVVTPENVQRAAEGIIEGRAHFILAMERRVAGDWSTDAGLVVVLPSPSHEPAASTVPTLTMDDLLRGWAADHGFQIDAQPILRAAYDRMRTLARLKAFLGHDDASRVAKADTVRWKEDMLGRSRSVLTIRNDLSEMSAIWTWGLRNGKLTGDNPFAGVSPPKPKKREKTRDGFTDEQAAMILRAARKETSPFLRWAPFLLCFSGARVGEVAQCLKADVATIQGVPTLRIHDDGAFRTVKNETSRRVIPLHPDVIAEGFLEYVATLPASSPLWPDIKVSKTFGTRSAEASRGMSRWLRADLGLTDKRIGPAHSWRHWFEDAARAVLMNAEARDAITGHSRNQNEGAHYGAGMGSHIKVLAEALKALRSPLADPGSD
jgi:integrase